jgi:hypothetical protein
MAKGAWYIDSGARTSWRCDSKDFDLVIIINLLGSILIRIRTKNILVLVSLTYERNTALVLR